MTCVRPVIKAPGSIGFLQQFSGEQSRCRPIDCNTRPRGSGEPFYAYVMGLNDVIKHNADGHRAYLLGRFSNHGWWQYFLVAFLVKTPTAVLLASFLALVKSFLSHGDGFDPRLLDLCIALPPMIFFALAMCASITSASAKYCPCILFCMCASLLYGFKHSTALLRKARCWVLGALIACVREYLQDLPALSGFLNWAIRRSGQWTALLVRFKHRLGSGPASIEALHRRARRDALGARRCSGRATFDNMG